MRVENLKYKNRHKPKKKLNKPMKKLFFILSFQLRFLILHEFSGMKYILMPLFQKTTEPFFLNFIFDILIDLINLQKIIFCLQKHLFHILY